MRWLLVVVVACSQPTSPSPSKPPPVDDPPGEVVKPVAEGPGFVWQKERDGYKRFDGGACREPSPDNPTDCPRPPTRLAGQIVSSAVTGGAVVITIDRGRRDHVDRNWTATLLDDRDRAVAPAVAIIRVEDAVTDARIELTPDSIAQHRHILLELKHR
ncbi:MAG: hypothetical protein ABI867_45355 [Kofleriaceae bacterium]